MKNVKIPIKKLNMKGKNNNFKLFHYILYQQNKLKKNLGCNSFLLNNKPTFNEELIKEKPIVIEHFINKENDNENDLFYFNNKSSYSKKYYNLDYRLKDNNNYMSRNSISSKNSRINLSSLISEMYYKKNFNKGIDSIWKNESKSKINFCINNEDEKNNYLFINKNIHDILNKTHYKSKLNLVFFPKRILNNRHFNKNSKKEKKKSLSNDGKYYNKINIKLKFKYKNMIKSKSSFYENIKKESNDMSQRNRFNKIKKELNQETIKINNMISEFFKGPLYNKFNKIDKIEDLKLRNLLKRPRSSLSL